MGGSDIGVCGTGSDHFEWRIGPLFKPSNHADVLTLLIG